MGHLEVCLGKSISTGIQRVLVPWLIAYSGLSFKSTLMSVVKEMIIAILDANSWLGDGVKSAEEAKRFPIALLDLAKRAKSAAVIFLSFLFLNMECS